ncbi:MAG: UDP-N-acetylmuramoyl-L-alanyl-D-glutamate--2,6-diaminopimelate ligase [Chloroflexi bacterium]|nr:UDP-N-acetylmuramoyl-L-alanyl-D-glutamate--2,6-diaminopimelate ligase [Chloroflexota bacterium]
MPFLGQLLTGVPGALPARMGNPDITSMCYDSRRAGPGALFVAVPGFTTDGHRFVAEAAARGCAAVVVQASSMAAGSVDLSALPPGVAAVVVPDTRRALAQLAAAFYGYPARHMKVVGVTGTDGKTTTTYLIAALLEAAGRRVGLMGTVEFKVGDKTLTNTTRQTTPESLEVQALLAEALSVGAEDAVIETSSHALELERVTGCEYDVAVVTNVSGDHLDFHGSFEAYLAAKAKLFAMLGVAAPKGVPKTAVLNADDPASFGPFRAAARADRIMTYAIDGEATVTAREVVLGPDGARFLLSTPEGDVPVTTHLPARFNVANCLAAASAALALGIGPDTIARGLAAFEGVPGRMERIALGQPYTVIVDYAHTPDSMRKVLQNLRAVTAGRLIVVFGAAGGRDRARRGGLGRVVGELADFAIAANEDPRHERPADILAEIAVGLEERGRRAGADFLQIVERGEAIAEAFRRAQPGDIVIIAGKGHEQSMIVGDEKLPWDDRTAARAALRREGYGA